MSLFQFSVFVSVCTSVCVCVLVRVWVSLCAANELSAYVCVCVCVCVCGELGIGLGNHTRPGVCQSLRSQFWCRSNFFCFYQVRSLFPRLSPWLDRVLCGRTRSRVLWSSLVSNGQSQSQK